MKFPSFKKDDSSLCHIDCISKGVTPKKICRKSDDFGLSDCNNVIFKDGALQNRLGLSTDYANLIDNSEYADKIYSSTEKTGIEIETDYGTAQMILEKIDYDISTHILLTHFINDNGTFYKSVPIYFQRVEDQVFYIPLKVSFFKGKPVSGGGIFALVYLSNRYNSKQKNSRIYELNSDFSKWERLYSPYIPTVYINGRGNHYEVAKSTNQAFEGTPKLLEDLNLLEHRFHSYFSTDGISSAFRLPYSSLSNDRVVCRLYHSVDNYVEWIAEEGNNTDSQTLYNVTVTMTVNREKGIVSFSVPSGEYAMPLINDRNENNLRITATKSCDYDIDDICFADSYLSHKGKIYLASKGCIFTARESNPLYFPRESLVKITDQDQKITALCPLKDKIIAFSQEKIFSLSITDGKPLNTLSLLAENDSVFHESDIIKHSVISNTVGCSAGASVCGDLSRIFWIGGDGLPYCLLSSEKISCLSNMMPKPWLTDWWGECFGLIDGNQVIFFKGNYALVLTSHKLPSTLKDVMEVYYWEFPSNLLFLCGYTSKGRPRIVSNSIPSQLLFVSTLEGSNDTYLDVDNFETSLITKNITSSFQSSALNFGCENTAKKIHSVSLNLEYDKAEISINKSFKINLTGQNSNRKVKLFAGITNAYSLTLSLNSTKPFKLRDIDIKYTSLGV